MYGIETVTPTWSLGMVEELEPVATTSWDEADDLMCREVARGRIVLRLDEQAGRPRSRVYIVSCADGSALVVFVFGPGRPTLYRATDPAVAAAGARRVLESGSAFNW